ncbi:META domain-containing protein [Vreelandella zhanjiangensis]|uniref:META domain-containing protein n=1 Tax=Vreelandella zhanjiangensis TaxID=1121960 RepID=UPI00036FB3BF|nr:META domain-containing protein [Halomonas zhanjiangensis]
MMKKHSFLVALMVSTLALTGCTGINAVSSDAASNASLENTYWKLVTVGKEQTVVSGEAREAHLVLHTEGARLAGSTGCNNLMGLYEQKGDQLSFGQLATTRMACPSELMALERNFLNALNDVASWQVVGETLTLDNAQGEELARFEAVYLY